MQLKNTIFLLLNIIVLFQSVFAQTDKKSPVLPKSASNLQDFVPAEWKIAKKMEGDLDADGIFETVLVLQGANQGLIRDGGLDYNSVFIDEKTGDLKRLADNNPVILAVLTKEKDSYKLAAQNNRLIPLFSDGWYVWNHAVSLENKTLKVDLNGQVAWGVMDVFGGETKTFRFQMQDSRLVLTEAKTIGWSNAVFSSFGRGNGRRDFFEKYDFLKSRGFLTYTSRADEEPITETVSKITDLIPFDLVTNSFPELKAIANTKTDRKKDTPQNNLIKIPYGVKKIDFYYQFDRDKEGEKIVEKEAADRAEEIYKFGEADNFKCEEHNFRVIDWINGAFTKKNSHQNAYLYRLCSAGKAQYSTSLGGIIVSEKGKIKAHYVFSNISGFDRMNVLPDINKNGSSEVVLEFAHSINSLYFARAIGIYEIGANGNFNSLGETDVFRRFENQEAEDISYTVFVKKGESPEFFRETYESESQRNEWKQTQKLTKFELEKKSEIKLRTLLPAK